MPKHSQRSDTQLTNIAKAHLAPGEIPFLQKSGIFAIERKAEGAYFWDERGKRFLDCRNDAGTYNVGRRNPAVIRALENALKEHDIGDNFLASEPKADLAEKLVEISPNQELKGVTYCVSGGEVVDFAIKLARGFTGRREIIAMKKAYHGVTGFSLSATADRAYKSPFPSLAPDFTHVRFNDIAALKRAISKKTAAIILEPVQGEGGVHVPSEDYLPAVRDLCDQYGALLIADEIQTGFGRTGKMFCVEHSNTVPDIMTLGKSISGGIYPITAALYRSKLQSFIEKHPFCQLSSLGGSDLGCVVAMATINEIEERGLSENAADQGHWILNELKKLQNQHPLLMKEARGKGLELGIEMRFGKLGRMLSHQLYERGVMAPFGVHQPAIIRLLPSLIITRKEAKFLVDAVTDSLAEIASSGHLIEKALQLPHSKRRSSHARLKAKRSETDVQAA